MSFWWFTFLYFLGQSFVLWSFWWGHQQMVNCHILGGSATGAEKTMCFPVWGLVLGLQMRGNGPPPQGRTPPTLPHNPTRALSSSRNLSSHGASQGHYFPRPICGPIPPDHCIPRLNLRRETCQLALFSDEESAARAIQPAICWWATSKPCIQPTRTIRVFKKPHGASTVWGIMTQFVHGFWIMILVIAKVADFEIFWMIYFFIFWHIFEIFDLFMDRISVACGNIPALGLGKLVGL